MNLIFIRTAAIIVLGFIAFGSMLSAPFRVMDDRLSIVENPLIRSFGNVPKLFREGYFHDQSYYRPLINLSYMVEYKFFGFEPFYFNLDNLILHVLNALLVWLLVSRLTGDEGIGFWSGLLFVFHPLQWEAVCNISGRSILLSAFFVLVTFVFFWEFLYHCRKWCLFMVPVTFFLGLLCKESAAMLPFVVTAFLATDQKMAWDKKWKVLWPFAVGLAAYLFLRKLFCVTQLHQSSGLNVLLLGFVTFLRSVMTDLRLFIFPVDLHFDRSLPFMMSLTQPQAVGTIFFWWGVIVLISLYYRKIPPFILFLMAWFCLELLPVSQLVTSIGVGAGHISTAEHFLYLASIPVLIGMVMAFRWLFRLCVPKGLVQAALLKFAAAGFLAFLLLTSIEQSIYASNEYNMVKRSLIFEPFNARLQGSMAMLSVFRNDIPDAEKHFRLAIKAEPLNATYHIGLGTALCQQGRWIEGLEQFVAFDPGKDKALVDRQERLTMMHIQNQLDQGKTFDARGWLAIGIYYAKIALPDKAVEAFLKTVQIDPNQTDAWFNLGSIYEAQGKLDSARSAYSRLLTIPQASFFQKDFSAKHLTMLGHH